MDDRLRALERAVRADPGDVGAALVFAHALEHAGEREAAWLERCRLARETDDDRAWAALMPQPRGPVHVEVGRARLLDRRCHGLLTDGRTVALAIGEDELQGVDATTLETVWRAPRAGRLLVRAGPFAAHATPPGLAVEDLRDGRRRAVPLAGANLESLACSDSRAVGFVGDTPGRVARAVVTDLADGTATEWPVASVGLVARGACVVTSRSEVTAHDLRTGEVRWTARGRAVAADDLGLLLVRDGGRGALEVVDVSLTLGAERWTWLIAADAPVQLALSRDLLVVATSPAAWARGGPARQLDVVAVERTSGDARWTLDDEVGLHAVAGVVATPEVVYVAHAPATTEDGAGQRSPPMLTLRVVDAVTGALRGTHAVPLERPAARVHLAPVEGGVVLAVERPRATTLVRVGA